MGISQIGNLNPVATNGSAEAEFEPLPIARVENSANVTDDSYSPAGGEPAGGTDDGESGSDFDGQPGETEAEVFAAPTSEKRAAWEISFFA